jgi:hypothetical protein
MRDSHRKYGIPAMLALVLLFGLLLAAGPASAITPPGSQWGGHDVNGLAYLVSIEKYVTIQLVADDVRVSGTLDITIKNQWFDAEGVGHQSGSFNLYNAAGSWRCAYWETLYYFNAKSSEDPIQELVLECVATGTGAYKGLTFVSAQFAVQNSPWKVKGWILPAN